MERFPVNKTNNLWLRRTIMLYSVSLYLSSGVPSCLTSCSGVCMSTSFLKTSWIIYIYRCLTPIFILFRLHCSFRCGVKNIMPLNNVKPAFQYNMLCFNSPAVVICMYFRHVWDKCSALNVPDDFFFCTIKLNYSFDLIVHQRQDMQVSNF